MPLNAYTDPQICGLHGAPANPRDSLMRWDRQHQAAFGVCVHW